MPQNITAERAGSLLKKWDNICVYSHANPDGDTLGSATGLIRSLENMGKRCAFRCSDEPDRKYDYLFDGLKLECKADEIEYRVTVDIADTKLMGRIYREYIENPDMFDLAIDHHGTHVPFAKEEWVVGGAPSNCELIYMLLKENGMPIDTHTADCLFTGIATDTGSFKFASVTPETHIIAAELMRLGANAGKINLAMFDTITKEYMEAEKKVLGGLRFYSEDRIAVIDVPLSVKEETGCSDADIDLLPSIPRKIEGVIIGITFKQKSENVWKASIRSIAPIDSSEICHEFGGGGHAGAAGCSFETSLEEAEKLLTEACEKHLRAKL
ncbi:MAG: bifunctional oligoribonuclease/PAP phosphatase NrnA [Clostridia bacterium]|nr:bifunctional oligoribonuclease/PAP phosphatase NrnA [Clostridia bacterium]